MFEHLKEQLHLDPFVPLTLALNSGDKFRIDDADMVLLSDSVLTYYVPRSEAVVYIRRNQMTFLQVGE